MRMQMAVRKQRRAIRPAQSSMKIMNRQTNPVPRFDSAEEPFRTGELISILIES